MMSGLLRSGVWWACLLCLAAPPVASAQTEAGHFSGQRVRVSTIIAPNVWHDGIVQSTSITHLKL